MSSIQRLELVKVFEKQRKLFENRRRFCEELKVSSPRLDLLYNQLAICVVTPYQFYDDVLKDWINANGEEATVQNLQKVLLKMEMKALSGKINLSFYFY